MRRKTARRTPSGRPQCSLRAANPSPSTPLLSGDWELLVQKLDPFLKTLDDQERKDMLPAAEALARRPGGMRGLRHRRPPQPIEVVFARDGREVVGALLLRRKWMERTFDESGGNEAQGADPPEKVSALADWLNEFGGFLGLLLSREMEFASFSGYLYEDVDDFLDVLEHWSNNWPAERLDRLLSLPGMRQWRNYARHGNPQQRRRLRRLEERQLPESRGRPEMEPEDRRMVDVLKAIRDAHSKLKEPFQACQVLRKAAKPGGYGSSPEAVEGELLKKGYSGDVVAAVVNSRTQPGAVQRFVASNSNGRYTTASIRSIMSTYKKHLGLPQ